MNIKTLIQSYYDSLNKKDNRWQTLYSDDAIFCDASKLLVATGKREVIESFTTFLKGVERVQIKQMILDGNTACVIASYSYINSKEEKMHQDVSEVWEIKDEKLVKLTIYFDLSAYRNFMRK